MMNSEEKDTDLYEVLGVNYNSTKEEIDKAYRRKAIKYHPDKNRNNVEAATKIFHQISVAYKTLTDPRKKLEYDNIYKAKIESKKRFEKLDAKRKAFKEELEEREEAVKQSRKTPVYTQESCEAKIERIKEETARRRQEREKKLRLSADQRLKASTTYTPSSSTSESSSKPVFEGIDFESIILNKMIMIEQEKLEVIEQEKVEVIKQEKIEELNEKWSNAYEEYSRPFMWSEDAVRLLLFYLKEHKEELDELAKTRSTKIKKKLWENASAVLREHGYEITPEHCSVKWKNIRQGHKEIGKLIKVEEILDQALSKQK